MNFTLRQLLIVALLGLGLAASAQTKITASAPSVVSEGDQFQVQYTVNTNQVEKLVQVKDFPGFKTIFGPAVSRSSSISIINGRQTSSSSTTYTYTLSALKAGTYTLPAQTVVVEGKSYTSNAPKVQVVAGQAPGQGGTGARGQGGRTPGQRHEEEARESSRPAAGRELFITSSASKHEVYEQEPVFLTYNIFTNVNIEHLDGKMPQLNGFMTKEIPLPQNRQWTIKPYKDKNYHSTAWCQYVVFPQNTGKLTIPAIDFKGVVTVVDRRRIDPDELMDAFFNGMSAFQQYQEERHIKAPAINIVVKPLPDKPEGFSGAVGSFTVKAEVKTKTVKENEPVEIQLTISGTGNVELITPPALAFPSDFDTYDPKTQANTDLTAEGQQGSLVVSYTAVPKRMGRYTIPAAEFIYFDPAAGEYRTLHTEPFQLDVAKGEKNIYADRQREILENSDIRHIHPDAPELRADDSRFFGGASYWLSYALLLAAFAVAALLLRRRAIAMDDTVGQKVRGANRRSLRHLHRAQTLLKQGKGEAFYEETHSALLGYAADKLNLPAGELAKERIQEAFTRQGASEAVTADFLRLLDTCEFARFAQGAAGMSPEEVYNESVRLITALDKTIKRRSRKMKTPLLLALLLQFALLLPAAATPQSDKALADSLYTAKRYQQAAALYEQLLNSCDDAHLHYNLGCAYFRLDDMARAILHFERACLRQPGNDDIRFNLELARTKTEDKIEVQGEFFFTPWLRSLVNQRNADQWGRGALVLLALTLACALGYLFLRRLLWRKLSFYAAVVLLLGVIVCNLCGYAQQRQLLLHNQAIVMGTAPVKSTPVDSGKTVFTLHAGTKAEVSDNTLKEWVQIRLADGKTGWIKRDAIETI